ncbi:hypothetical protein GLOIN_2v1778495 [Rhizophagus clarus]|uniref:Uncharacterized protein n=1 Tax=Rhizophagus clarus TaxID=94130 RepID=A0A8H3MAD3_9GLOM|nr:hypothetical protein GLOIN_2v1778495 [Rhizophagus clarus]
MLAYVSQQYTENEVHEIINESTFLQFEKEENEFDNKRNTFILDIPNHEVDINEDISNNEGNSENELDNSEDVEMESNYNIEELIQQYSLDDKLVEDTL